MAKATSAKAGNRAKRREELRRNLPRPSLDYLALLRRPEILRATLVFVLFAAAVTATVDWGRHQVMVRDGQVMTETRAARLDYIDRDKTEAAIEAARNETARIFVPNADYLKRLEAELMGLPRAMAGRTDPAEVAPELAGPHLTSEVLAALQNESVEGVATEEWRGRVRDLIDRELIDNPLLTSADFQVFTVSLKPQLIREDGSSHDLNARYGIEADDDRVDEHLVELLRDAGFPRKIEKYLASRLTSSPTITFATTLTDAAEMQAAASVDEVMIEAGAILYRRGELLTPTAYTEVTNEAAAFEAQPATAGTWVPRLGILGLSVIIALCLQVFVAFNYPRILNNTTRLVSLCALMAAMLVVAVAVTKNAPPVLYFSAVSPTLFVAIVVLLVYDHRLAAIVATAQTTLVALALQQSAGWLLMGLVGCGAMIALLHEVRHRNSMIRAASGTAFVLGAAALVLGIAETPLVDGAWRQISVNAGWAGAASFGVGFLVLGMLPTIERVFGVTTGMTLAELRDPKQPLLRQLQQRAPGTYNHSLQVANLCEAAAEAIGADELLVYVGAMYHDIGKINKPEYFVENQARGDNKHEKLSPAMSLLVIIGHVKDGIELAREYGLPRPLIHFIESHHGTTLVEYFFHAAREQAETDEKLSVDEVEFRYPGPKPQTREGAILMLADAVESATRTIAEPNPARIESLVSELSRKRMTDGQFDQCPLTFAELGLIEDAIITRLCAIHHGRISYPSQKTDEVVEEDEPARVRA
jgi:putative nucleotidyltransferase with HDIG domain